jgi:hypothetical protein
MCSVWLMVVLTHTYEYVFVCIIFLKIQALLHYRCFQSIKQCDYCVVFCDKEVLMILTSIFITVHAIISRQVVNY